MCVLWILFPLKKKYCIYSSEVYSKGTMKANGNIYMWFELFILLNIYVSAYGFQKKTEMGIFKGKDKLESVNLDDLILLKIQKYRINCKQNTDNLIFVVYNERIFHSLLLLSLKGINCSVQLLESSCKPGYPTYLPIFYDQTDVYANHTCSNSRSSASVNHFKITSVSKT